MVPKRNNFVRGTTRLASLGSPPNLGGELLSLSAETRVRGLDEHSCGPGTGIRTVAGTIGQAWIRLLDLFQRHAALNHVVDSVSNIGNHVSVFNQVRLIRNATTGDRTAVAYPTELEFDNRLDPATSEWMVKPSSTVSARSPSALRSKGWLS